ncbi:MAG TPA: ABC transporter substrate-binding protein [Xanthobacteraceae bacterium]|nr:ABC transporter substrate-binding protein [Xanthobacteraceae bacterium]
MFRFASLARALVVAAIAVSFLAAPAARAEKIGIGLVGSISSTHWPIYIGLKKGYFAAEGIEPDLVFTQSNAALLQQLAAGSLDVALSAGLVDPLRAIDKGASIAVVRLEMQVPPYALMAKPAIKSAKDLKGKVISIGGPKDITRIYVERILTPNGVKPGDFDMVFAGATAARFSALQSGAVDAAILLPPYNFYAESAGFNNLGLVLTYAPELPFSSSVVNRAWANGHKALLDKLLSVHTKSMQWFSDPKNRDEAIAIMVEASKLKADDVAKSYDFLQKNQIFEPTGTVSRKKMTALIGVLHELGDIQGSLDVDRFILSGITKLSD